MTMIPTIEKFQKNLPPGYFLEIGGEYEEQVKSFKQLGVVMAVSVALIYMALVPQFKNAVKPLLVFAASPTNAPAMPYGIAVMGQPFGFTALGYYCKRPSVAAGASSRLLTHRPCPERE
jgi:multidrug efflux pump subunit AcrB